MNRPRPMAELAERLSSLPGIGSRKAEELAEYLATCNPGIAQALAMAITEVNRNSVICSQCRMDTDQPICHLCRDATRRPRQLCVVGHSMDVVVLEKTGLYRGRYHVLRGELDPMLGITPSKLEIESLLNRIEPMGHDPTAEVIIATNQTLKGDITAQVVTECIRRAGFTIPISRLKSGIAKGQRVQTADPTTLGNAFTNRDIWIPTEPE